MRTIFWPCTLAALLWAGCDSGKKPDYPHPAEAVPYNIILVSLDTLRPDHLGCYGSKLGASPSIDRFAKKSVVFTEARSQSPWTTPSHASLFTSLYPSVLNIGRWPNPGRINPKTYTMAEYLGDEGYATAAFIEGGMISGKFGFDQGFEPFVDGLKHIQFSVPECLSWIDKNRGNRFFVFLHTYDIHRYNPPEEYADTYMPDYEGSLKRGYDLQKAVQRYFGYKPFENEEDRKKIVALYNDEILYADHWMGELVKGLESRDLLKETVVILTSDHGEEFWEHGRTGHGYTNFEEVLRVPLIIHHPKIPGGRREDLVRLVDVLPTIADMVGGSPRPEWQGESFFPVLQGGPGRNIRFSFAEAGHIQHESVHGRRWKLVRKYTAPKETGVAFVDALYDLENDPRETKDVSEKHPQEFERLKKLLEALLDSNRRMKKDYKALEADIDPELMKQLEELGYADGG